MNERDIVWLEVASELDSNDKAEIERDRTERRQGRGTPRAMPNELPEARDAHPTTASS